MSSIASGYTSVCFCCRIRSSSVLAWRKNNLSGKLSWNDERWYIDMRNAGCFTIRKWNGMNWHLFHIFINSYLSWENPCELTSPKGLNGYTDGRCQMPKTCRRDRNRIWRIRIWMVKHSFIRWLLITICIVHATCKLSLDSHFPWESWSIFKIEFLRDVCVCMHLVFLVL